MTQYSHSRIGAFRTCPKKYDFSYIRKVPKASRGIEAYLGNRVHEALEWLYNGVCMGKVPDVGEVLERYRQGWEREWDPCVRVVRPEMTAEDYRLAGERLIRLYYERHYPFDRGTTIGLEESVFLQLDEEHKLRGFIDRLVKVADGVWEIHDYKTSRSLPTQEQADADRQLALYQMAVQEMHPDVTDVTLVWHYLFHDVEMRSTRTTEQLEAVRADVLADIAEIEAATDYPTNVSKLCDWCEYRDICPAWSHEVSVEAAEPDGLAQDDDVSLVDRFVRASEAAGEVKREKDALRDELLRRMHEQEVEALAGSEQRVRLSSTPCVRVPSAGSAARQELEMRLKEVGVWDRCSTVSAKALGMVLDDPDLDEQVRRELEGYVTIEETETLRCSRREG